MLNLVLENVQIPNDENTFWFRFHEKAGADTVRDRKHACVNLILQEDTTC